MKSCLFILLINNNNNYKFCYILLSFDGMVLGLGGVNYPHYPSGMRSCMGLRKFTLRTFHFVVLA